MGTKTKITGTGERFQRPVSPNEWLYLAFERATGAPFVIQLVVEGRGTIALGELRRAVARASEAAPGVRSAVQGRLWADTGRAPSVRQAPDLDTALRAALDPARGRSCEVVVVRGGTGDDDTPTTLAFRSHHAAMDGRGLLGWALDVFRALRGEEPVGAPSDMDEVALLKQLTEGAGHAAAPRRPRQRARWRSPLSGPRENGGSRAPHWARRTLDGVHHALVARIAAAVTDHAGTAARVMVPVDLRRHRTDLRASGNLSLPVFLEGSPGRRWEAWQEDLLRALADGAELAAGEERDAARLPQGVLRLVGRVASAAAGALDRHPCTALVSHLGRIDPADVCAPDFEADTAYSLPVRVPLVPVSFTTLEFGRHTQLVVSAGRGQSVGAAASLLDAVCEQLAPATGAVRLSGGARLDVTGSTTLTALFHEQARRTPDAVALTCTAGREDPAGTVTYAELDKSSDAVAAYLRARGIGPGAVVALLDGRTPAVIAALWGVLKTGAAYLPLDPTHPSARIAAVLADSGAALCLAGEAYQAAVPDDSCPVLTLESLPRDGAEPVDRADDPVSPDSVAYVIYTSGSTGVPKGVEVQHRALTAYAGWARERYGVDEATRFGLFTSLAFDLTGTALFLPLLAGGSIVLEPGEPDRHTLTGLLNSSGVTALKLTPAHLDLMTSLGVTVPGGRIRSVVVGGEQLRGPAAARAQRLLGPDCRIFNEYGPTEAAIGCVVHTFDPEQDAERPAVPIGLPVPGTGTVLLDSDGRPAAEGELHLTGAQLARGYLGRPGLGRERFVRLADGTRAYRTGDLARLTAEGALEFLGRTDDQLSVRGFRIEPGEIEAVLERLPEVTRAVVTARPGRAGEPVLCAYVTGAFPGSLDGEQIRAYAAGLLPPYLVPAAVRVLDAFPLTANGKVDQRALPSPFARDQHPAGDDMQPESPESTGIDPLTAAVTDIWCRSLDTDIGNIDPGDAFHHLGGDSLTLLLMLSDVAAELVHADRRQVFQEELRDLLRDVTVERVCAAVRTANSGA